MKIDIIKLVQNQYDQWNRFVDLSPQGDVFCYSWWLDAVTKSRFEIYAIIENNEIVAGMPLAYDSYGKINEPYLTRTLGVLFSPQINITEYHQKSNQRKWLNALLECLSLNEFNQMCLHYNIKDCLPFKWKGLKQTTRYTYLLDFRSGAWSSMYENLNKSVKYNIRRAERNNIKVFESDDISLLYEYASMSFRRQGLKLRFSLGEIIELDNAIKKNGHRIILKAVDQLGRVHAMNYLSYNLRSAYSLISGSEPQYRKIGSHTLVLWEAIKFFSDKVQYFNFGGSNIRRIEEHRRGFGGDLTPYFHIYNDNLLNEGIYTHLQGVVFHVKGLGKSIITKII